MINILIVGSGGREHAIAHVLRRNSSIKNIFVSPGSYGEPDYTTVHLQFYFPYEEIIDFVRKNYIDLVIIGSEKYLADGMVDILQKEKIPVLGPTQKAAQLETSKIFSKELMQDAGVPTADFKIFSDFYKASSYIHSRKGPYVIKADGLAAGKGVFIAQSEIEAIAYLKFCLVDNELGTAGQRILIEEYIPGKELSLIAFTDGKNFQFLRASRDHKKLLDGNQGPNTGGMGAYSHIDMCAENIYSRSVDEILKPVFKKLETKGILYQGIIYIGLMLYSDTSFKVLEFNCRLGDPESQCVLPLLQTDLLSIFDFLLRGKLQEVKTSSNKDSSCTVVLASKGYPKSPELGYPIYGLDKLDKDVLLFHGGTKISENKNLQTNSGRVLSLTSIKQSLEKASSQVYENIKKITFEGCQYRTDIGKIIY